MRELSGQQIKNSPFGLALSLLRKIRNLDKLSLNFNVLCNEYVSGFEVIYCKESSKD